jgi:hypothetical protein
LFHEQEPVDARPGSPGRLVVVRRGRLLSASGDTRISHQHEVRLLLFHHDPWDDNRRLDALCTEAWSPHLGAAAWVAFRERMAIGPHGAARRLV